MSVGKMPNPVPPKRPAPQTRDTGMQWIPKYDSVPMPTPQKFNPNSTKGMAQVDSGYMQPKDPRMGNENGMYGPGHPMPYFIYESPDGRRIKMDGNGNVIWSRWMA